MLLPLLLLPLLLLPLLLLPPLLLPVLREPGMDWHSRRGSPGRGEGMTRSYPMEMSVPSFSRVMSMSMSTGSWKKLGQSSARWGGRAGTAGGGQAAAV
jgi:hypothetical protein